MIDILVQRCRNARAAKRFFRKVLKRQERTPIELVTDKVKSYGVARRRMMPSVEHNAARYSNTRRLRQCDGGTPSSSRKTL